MTVVAIVPAFQAGPTVGAVVRDLLLAGAETVIVVDDGSTDDTAVEARAAGAEVVSHPVNRGKGAALLTGLEAARRAGKTVVVTVDADGQHPASEALRLARDPAPDHALVLGVRDLVQAGAPRANQISNGISNAFLSLFTRRRLADTQCGLRRYPVTRTLGLDLRSTGYELEAEVVMRAAQAHWPIVQVPVRVVYPPAGERTTHFHSVKDPTRIVLRVLGTQLLRRHG
ncbi:MAG: glycosyltransferase family 2 protein [Myxococcales bacterium]|nr:glycosyltransferase family 2 protein [Myxococcales bacterium]MCB9580421.1 glycosyltransferase family 2 protein [Polyangiaceae bacterium]